MRSRASGRATRPDRSIFRGLRLPNGAEVIAPLAWSTARRTVTSTEGGAGANISERGRVVLIVSALPGGAYIAMTDPFGGAPVVPPVLPPTEPPNDENLGWLVPMMFLLLDDEEPPRP